LVLSQLFHNYVTYHVFVSVTTETNSKIEILPFHTYFIKNIPPLGNVHAVGGQINSSYFYVNHILTCF